MLSHACRYALLRLLRLYTLMPLLAAAAMILRYATQQYRCYRNRHTTSVRRFDAADC